MYNSIQLRLYIFESSQQSLTTIKSIEKLCYKYFEDAYKLTIIDAHKEPHAAQKDDVIAVPTLICEFAGNRMKLIGDFSNIDSLFVKIQQIIKNNDSNISKQNQPNKIHL